MSEPSCASFLLSNPEITGIGVRAAVYFQNLWSLWSAFTVITRSQKVGRDTLAAVEIQALPVITTGYAMLISTIIQNHTIGLSTFDGLIILNLSWINSTGACIWYLFLSQYSENLIFGHVPDTEEGPQEKTRDFFGNETFPQRIVRYWVLELTVLHLVFMAAIGIWLWSDPAKFQRSIPGCDNPVTSLFLLGRRVLVGPGEIRGWSITIYTAVLVGHMFLLGGFLVVISHLTYYLVHKFPPFRSRSRGTGIIFTGLVILSVTNVIFIVDTEIMLHTSDRFKQSSASQWTFGQTLALIVCAFSMLQVWAGNVQESEGKREHGSDANAQVDAFRNSEFTSALQSASYKGHVDGVKLLLELGANDKERGGMYNSAIQAALCQGHKDVIDALRAQSDFTEDITVYEDLGEGLRVWGDKEWNLGWGLLLLLPKRLKEEHGIKDEVRALAYETLPKVPELARK
ncbi:hypothetical protein GYMLUDRAFT_60081 [Collybiopsis luxurians FD-317 M1]|uniref:Unplaced genomic scaffold GYMLUscaffold_31, whole genome shotgun sequence n=1 Tax=Collybiopsis luxurians FD-317 M1 TaxID=944289 RepID=A0A0D0CLT7_9AGAR|nr:hypothetical protein GYMLUDRAFT_60081 [Collybiopsis luxurians FD-317 M1]